MADEQVRAFLTPFTTQSRITHLLAVVVGAGLFSEVYMVVLGDPGLAVADTPAALAGRQTAILVAGVPTGIYFGLLYTRAIGGPGLNILYPIVSMVALPFVIALSQGGLPTHLWTGAEFIFSARFATESLTFGLPGLVAFVGVYLGWFLLGLRSEEAVTEWLQTHTSEAYQEHVLGRKP